MRSFVRRLAVTGAASAVVGAVLALLALSGEARPDWDLLAFVGGCWLATFLAVAVADTVVSHKPGRKPRRKPLPDRIADRFNAVVQALERQFDLAQDQSRNPLDRWNDAVKDFILDGIPAPRPTSVPSPDDDTPLPPLDRVRLVAELKPRFLQAFREAVATVGRARTVRELAAYNAQITEILASLQGAILAEVLSEADLSRRVEVVTDLAVAADHAPPPESPARRRGPRPPSSWVGKYRRMRANR
jgi:hypothetical protein